MRLATFAVETPLGPERRVGVVAGDADGTGDDALVDVTTAYAAVLAEAGEATPAAVAEALAPPDMATFLRRGDRAMDAAREALSFARETDVERGPGGGRLRFSLGEDGVDLLAPVPRPNSIRDAMVFEEHVRNALGGDPPDVWYDLPVYYKSNPDAVVGPGETVVWPAYSERMDYELEIAAVIGKRGRDVPAEDADEYVAGYTVFDDFSARDAQMREMQGRLGPAKGKDFANALGPYLVTPDDPDFDLATATMRAEIDGEQWSEGVAGDMYHTFGDVIERVSASETLHPGDVVGSGTVGGGCGLELGRFLDDGATVALEIEGIGRLENRVVAADGT